MAPKKIIIASAHGVLEFMPLISMQAKTFPMVTRGPTERSNPPVKMTMVWPIETIPRKDADLSTEQICPYDVRNPLETNSPATHIATTNKNNIITSFCCRKKETTRKFLTSLAILITNLARSTTSWKEISYQNTPNIKGCSRRCKRKS